MTLGQADGHSDCLMFQAHDRWKCCFAADPVLWPPCGGRPFEKNVHTTVFNLVTCHIFYWFSSIGCIKPTVPLPTFYHTCKCILIRYTCIIDCGDAREGRARTNDPNVCAFHCVSRYNSAGFIELCPPRCTWVICGQVWLVGITVSTSKSWYGRFPSWDWGHVAVTN